MWLTQQLKLNSEIQKNAEIGGAYEEDVIEVEVISNKETSEQTETETVEEPETIAEQNITPNKTCPTNCNDNISCTFDYCNQTTNYECVHKNITVCIGGDNCCPSACAYNNDTDCSVPTANKCSDGTAYNSCSVTSPLYCKNGSLIGNCSLCNFKCPSKCFNNVCVTGECENDSDCDDGKINTHDSCNWNFDAFTADDYVTKCFHDLKALGTVNVAIVEFTQPDFEFGETVEFCNSQHCLMSDEENWEKYKEIYYCGTNLINCNYIKKFNFVSVLNSETNRKEVLKTICYIDSQGNGKNCTFYSLYYIENWYKSEASRYGVNVNLSIDVLGPYDTNILPPERGPYDSCNILQSYFQNEVSKNGFNLSGYDIINYIYFTDKDTGTAFWSCASSDAYISYSGADFGIGMSGLIDLISTVMHEIAHKFGADDSYNGFACIYPEGYFEPNKFPLYPQEKACLMCSHVPISENGGGVPMLLDEYVICDSEAKLIGWK